MFFFPFNIRTEMKLSDADLSNYLKAVFFIQQAKYDSLPTKTFFPSS